jgi:5-methylcytosine-specific restriction endonuclease McrA
MRQLRRLRLGARERAYLTKRRGKVTAATDIDAAWASARGTKTMARVFDVLRSMAGTTARCMFCEDSRGTDIEHFWPRAVHRKRAFRWANFLLACSGCNALKGARFPRDLNGRPLLINPTIENPWDHLHFDHHTGMITAKFDTTSNAPDTKGFATTDPSMLPLNIQDVTEGRQVIWRHLLRAFVAFRAQTAQGRADALPELIAAINDSRAYGIADWLFLYDGRDDPVSSSLRADFPAAFEAVAQHLRTHPR